MSDNVILLPVETKLDIPPERVLNAAIDHGLDTVVIVGFDNNEEFYFAVSEPDRRAVLWLLERAKKELLEQP